MKNFILIWILLITNAFAVTSNTGKFDQLTTNNASKTTVDILKNVDMQSTGGVYIPKGTTGQRPAPTKDGMLRFNSTLGRAEMFIGASWTAVGGGLSAWVTATAYQVDDIVVQSNKIYKCLIAHTSGTFATDLASLDWVELSSQGDLTGAITSSGLATSLGSFTSANLKTALTDESGSGVAYFQGGDIGTPSAGVLTNATGLPIASGVSGLAANVATVLATPSSANLRAALTDESGSGAAYFQNGDIGTPSAGVLTNATGLPIASGVSGLGTGVATFLATPSSANLASALTDETGTLKTVFSDAPTFTTNLTAPLIIGGTGTTSTLTLKATSGNGTTNSDMIFQVGNNGATEAMRILNTGAIGVGVAAPNANAILDVTSTTKAFMPPRMTTAQKNSVASPTAGMQVYDSTLNCLSVYNGTAWVNVTSQAASTANATSFSWQVSSTGTVSGENLDVINSNCTNANPSVCTFNASIFTVAPNCTTTITNTANNLALTAPATSTSTTVTIQQNSSIVATQEPFTVHCQKQGADYTAAASNGTVASTLIGYAQVPGISSGSVSVFSASYGTTNATTVCSASPCSYLDQIGTEVSSITRASTGVYTVNLARTYTKLKCTITGSLAGTTPATFTAMSCSSCSSIGISSYNIDAAPVIVANTYGTLVCQGSY